MPLRTRIKRAFTRSSRDNSSDDLAAKNARKDSIHYQPGEKMPPLKYRRPVDPKHKEHLESFTWAKAWRRRSDCSLYSPMGSRLPSRKTSATTLGRRSIGARSTRSLGGRSTRSIGGRSVRDRRTSSRGRGAPVDNEMLGVDSAIGSSLAGDDGRDHDHIREWSDEEEDITTVGLSRNPTQDPRKDKSSARRAESIKSGGSRPPTSDRRRRESVTAPNAQPFSAEELELALQKSHLDATREESDRSGDGSPHDSVMKLRPREGLLQVPMN
ncbi:hypothetical protein BDV96DRAFT_595808 [Lophiotrema nucula]|uniref:Uncharacterized protein n=1 Tax=Lophiotrema nucula TaxID=690887 RepID=A0A6A5ZKR6_9PLEO|nr:hypothetical protein BDV96DRAFT_595808 [Lophiotrema nucula]